MMRAKWRALLYALILSPLLYARPKSLNYKVLNPSEEFGFFPELSPYVRQKGCRCGGGLGVAKGPSSRSNEARKEQVFSTNRLLRNNRIQGTYFK